MTDPLPPKPWPEPDHCAEIADAIRSKFPLDPVDGELVLRLDTACPKAEVDDVFAAYAHIRYKNTPEEWAIAWLNREPDELFEEPEPEDDEQEAVTLKVKVRRFFRRG